MNKMIKWLGNYWVSGAALIMLGFSIAINFGNFSSNDTSIILTFVGILATFIVVGNYAQVMTIKKDSDDKIEELNNLIKEQKKSNVNTNKLINGVEASLNGAIMHNQGIFQKNKSNFRNAYNCFIEASISYTIALSHNYSVTSTSNNLEITLREVNNLLELISNDDFTTINSTPLHNLDVLLSSIPKNHFNNLIELIKQTKSKRKF